MHGSAYAFDGGFGAHVNSETLRGTYFREALRTRSFAKTKTSTNGEITLRFADEGESCPSRKI